MFSKQYNSFDNIGVCLMAFDRIPKPLGVKISQFKEFNKAIIKKLMVIFDFLKTFYKDNDSITFTRRHLEIYVFIMNTASIIASHRAKLFKHSSLLQIMQLWEYTQGVSS